MQKNIVIFASGSGTNAENIIKYFTGNKNIKVCAVFTNNAEAGVVARAKALEVPVFVFDKNIYKNELYFLDKLRHYHTDFIILAGFLWLIPKYLCEAFCNRIINIHPSLLPKYGGKGMYGMHVHEAVKNNREANTGISIHYVNEQYDEGALIFQEKVNILPSDSAEDIAQKVHRLEYLHYPRIIEKVVMGIE